MTSPRVHSGACHNCRRRRLKCDRTLPHCLKCFHKGQECLGYQRLLRWEPAIVGCFKPAGTKSNDAEEARQSSESSSSKSLSPAIRSSRQLLNLHGIVDAFPYASLTDPLVQDLDLTSRKYLSYFASHVCKDLVLYDVPKHNPFRELIALTDHHPVLLDVIVGNAALHMSNASQRLPISDKIDVSLNERIRFLTSARSDSAASQTLKCYNDALAAKQRALFLLNSSLTNIDLADIDAILAAVLLFVEFELMDSGRDNWKHHIAGARAVIKILSDSSPMIYTDMSSLRSYLISNCLVFDIIGSSFATSQGLSTSDIFPADAHSLLSDADGNHCSSFPIVLLELIQTGAHWLNSEVLETQEAFVKLLTAAQSFDPQAWAVSIQQYSPATDIEHRTHIGCAHRAAVCIYLSRVTLSLYPETRLSFDLESLVTDVIFHLSFIKSDTALYKATPWPTFIAGAETNDSAKQEWVLRRFEELWDIEPWGLIKGALRVLESIWADETRQGKGSGTRKVLKSRGDWIDDLRSRGVDWLII